MKSLEGQNLIDIAIQQAGSAEAVYQTAKLNNISLTDDIEPGAEVKSPDVLNKDIQLYFSNKCLQPGTADTREIDSVNRILFEELSIEFF